MLRTNASQIQPAEQSIMELDRRHEMPDRLLYWQPPPLRARTWFPGKRPARTIEWSQRQPPIDVLHPDPSRLRVVFFPAS